MNNILRILFIVLFLLSGGPGFAREVSVSMTEWQGIYQLKGDFEVAAPLNKVWEVLTDYDHIDEFVSSIERSEVKERGIHSLLLEQSAIAGAFVFKKKVDVLLKVLEQPTKEIIFVDISHHDFELYEGSWSLESVPNGVEVRYEMIAEPRTRTPRFLTRAAFLKTSRNLLKEVRTEILSRK